MLDNNIEDREKFREVHKLENMLLMQKQLQYQLSKKFPDRTENNILGNTNIGDIVDKIESMRGFINEEITELVDALGNEDNAVRKPWKKDYDKLRSMNLSTHPNLPKIKEEAVDVLHFILNIFILVDMSAEEMFDIYMMKNKENHNRQLTGY